VAVETRLADHDARAPAVGVTPCSDPGADGVDPVACEAEPLALDSGGGAVLAEDRAQRVGPFAGGDPPAGALDREWHQVLAGLRRVAEPPERRVDLRLAPAASRRAQHVEGLGCRAGVEAEEPAVVPGDQGGRQSVGPPVPPDDGHLAAVDAGEPLRLAPHQRALHVAGLHRGQRAARLPDTGDLRVGRGVLRRKGPQTVDIPVVHAEHRRDEHRVVNFAVGGALRASHRDVLLCDRPAILAHLVGDGKERLQLRRYVRPLIGNRYGIDKSPVAVEQLNGSGRVAGGAEDALVSRGDEGGDELPLARREGRWAPQEDVRELAHRAGGLRVIYKERSDPGNPGGHGNVGYGANRLHRRI